MIKIKIIILFKCDIIFRNGVIKFEIKTFIFFQHCHCRTLTNIRYMVTVNKSIREKEGERARTTSRGLMRKVKDENRYGKYC